MMNRRRLISGFVLTIMAMMAWQVTAQRRITPVNTAATMTQSINETKNDTARINAAKRASMVHYHDENGRVIYVDTVTGREWVDTTAIVRKVPMKYPLLVDIAAGINLWDPVMRMFGQKYGLIDGFVQVNLHNRYFPTLEVGAGMAKNTPEDLNFTYRSPVSPYFRIGVDYNFLYNSNPDYKFFAGLRYGFSKFRYSLENVTIGSDYWGEPAVVDIPAQSASAGWLELSIGLRVKLWGPISAGWTIKYHSLLNQSKSPYGRPWYIPGYGSRQSKLAGAISIVYTLPVKPRKAKSAEQDAPPVPAGEDAHVHQSGQAGADTQQLSN